jgi:uncharacterized protein (TIGR02246 family)
MSRQEALRQVAAAADALVGAFAAHDRDAYFAAFSPQATFVFHTCPRVLGSRAEYEAEWAAWEADGFHVNACASLERRIDIVGEDVAVLTHQVRTHLAGADEVMRERETIVFRREADGRWRAVHEHLSPDPLEDA